MAFFVTLGGASVNLVLGLGSSHRVGGLTTDAFVVDDGVVFTTGLTPATPLAATPIVPPLVSPPMEVVHPVGTAFLPTATLDHAVLATTGTMGSAVLAGSLAPLGDQFAHAISDWLMDLS